MSKRAVTNKISESFNKTSGGIPHQTMVWTLAQLVSRELEASTPISIRITGPSRPEKAEVQTTTFPGFAHLTSDPCEIEFCSGSSTAMDQKRLAKPRGHTTANINLARHKATCPLSLPHTVFSQLALLFKTQEWPKEHTEWLDRMLLWIEKHKASPRAAILHVSPTLKSLCPKEGGRGLLRGMALVMGATLIDVIASAEKLHIKNREHHRRAKCMQLILKNDDPLVDSLRHRFSELSTTLVHRNEFLELIVNPTTPNCRQYLELFIRPLITPNSTGLVEGPNNRDRDQYESGQRFENPRHTTFAALLFDPHSHKHLVIEPKTSTRKAAYSKWWSDSAASLRETIEEVCGP